MEKKQAVEIVTKVIMKIYNGKISRFHINENGAKEFEYGWIIHYNYKQIKGVRALSNASWSWSNCN